MNDYNDLDNLFNGFLEYIKVCPKCKKRCEHKKECLLPNTNVYGKVWYCFNCCEYTDIVTENNNDYTLIIKT